MRRLFISLSAIGIWVTASGSPATAQTFNSGSTGADGAFNPTSSVAVTLPPSGVFNYTTVNIPVGVTVTYTRNLANTPVTILASGNVTIAGTININGAPAGPGGNFTGLGNNAGAGGPGGFDGGRGSNGVINTSGGTGLGPGGGAGGAGPSHNVRSGGGGGFAASGGNGGTVSGGAAYGSAALLPIIGGSGGGGGGADLGTTGGGGGGGGGAVLIASSGTVTLTGSILALGGAGYGGFGAPGATSGGGSGGAIRLVATTVTGTGTRDVRGGGGGVNTGGVVSAGSGSVGRIRVEAFTNTANFNVNGVPPSTTAPTTATLANPPSLQIVSVAGVASPPTPSASFATPDITLPSTTTNPVSIALAGVNIPPGTVVSVRAQGQADAVTTASATLAGSLASSSATASLAIPNNQPAVILATASFTVVASAGGGPIYVQGEEVERVQVSAGFGGVSRVAYITKSGREILVTPGR